MHNIEIKARINSLDAMAERIGALGAGPAQHVSQDDTFFHCNSGRLKLRATPDGSGQLVYYTRPDRTGPKASSYLLVPVSSPDALREALTLAYGQAGRVRKRRVVYLVGRTRIHLDTVETLGAFLELEVVLGANEAIESGVGEVEALMKRLGIEPSQLVASSYLELLQESSV